MRCWFCLRMDRADQMRPYAMVESPTVRALDAHTFCAARYVGEGLVELVVSTTST